MAFRADRRSAGPTKAPPAVREARAVLGKAKIFPEDFWVCIFLKKGRGMWREQGREKEEREEDGRREGGGEREGRKQREGAVELGVKERTGEVSRVHMTLGKHWKERARKGGVTGVGEGGREERRWFSFLWLLLASGRVGEPSGNVI